MADSPNPQDTLQLERQILRLLCQNQAARSKLTEALRQHRWRDLAHRVTFEMVCGALQLSAEQLRRVLPRRLTNAGFPDFPWEELFLPVELSLPEAEVFLRELQAGAAS
jgi:hypothetical protein